jgi:uncharacterized delta-60 repeat protein
MLLYSLRKSAASDPRNEPVFQEPPLFINDTFRILFYIIQQSMARTFTIIFLFSYCYHSRIRATNKNSASLRKLPGMPSKKLNLIFLLLNLSNFMKHLFFLLLLVIPIWTAAQPLFLDASFGSNGATISHTAGWSKEAYDLVQQPDGKLLTAGAEYEMNSEMYFLSIIARFLPDGSPDNNFGTNGSVRLLTGSKNAVEAIALQTDGKIVLAGNEYVVQGNSPNVQLITIPFIARLNANGTLDNSFGNNGIHRLGLLDGYDGKSLAAIAVLPNGQIIAGGTVATADLKMMLICLNADGTYNNNFGVSGMGQYAMEIGEDAGLWDLAIQNDGKIILAGASGSAGLASADDRLFAVARINADGTPDASFGTQGTVVTQISSGTNFIEDIAHKVTILPDGKICLAGTARNVLALARYHPDGTPDITFGQNGTIRHEQHPNVTGLAFRNGKLYTCGSISANDNILDIAVSAFNTDGSPDVTFAPNGMHTAHIYDRNYTHALLVQSDGKLVTAGSFSDDNNQQGLLLTRFTTNAPTGITPAQGKQMSIALYPNPANDLLTLTFREVTTAPQGNICIISPSGQIVYSGQLKGHQTTIPVNNLAAGIYALRVTTGMETQTLKFVKR